MSLAQVGEGHDIARVRRVARLVGHPHLHTINLDAGHQVRQCLHGAVVNLAEVVGEEEVAVLLIVGHIQFEGCGLLAALALHALRGGVLLREHRLQLQTAKLKVGADAEQARCARHQRVVGGEGHVAGLHQLDDFVFLAFILQFEVLRIEVERGIGVVVQVHVDLVAHLTVHAQVDLHVKVEGRGLPVTGRQTGVIYALERCAHLQLSRSLCLHAHAARTEDFLCRSQIEVHVGEVELLLALGSIVLGILLAEELLTGALLAPLQILVGCHHERGVQIAVAHL